MTKENLIFFESIDIHRWYSMLSKEYLIDHNEMLTNPKRKEIEKIIDGFGYCYSYSSTSKIYNIPTKLGPYTFYCNPEFRHGFISVILFAENVDTEKKMGDSFISICRQIEIAKGEDSGKYMIRPRFRNYNEIEKILSSVFKFYEKFKLNVLESKILE